MRLKFYIFESKLIFLIKLSTNLTAQFLIILTFINYPLLTKIDNFIVKVRNTFAY